ncbi:hypothetical protein HMPREF0367_01463 [[Eubacterium] cylindroides ATCC 27803]|uniref:Uncharacterized protein n=1 Tax=Faecalitalea cylindroides ATCC 27803 TaxID=649755 RepID=U2PH84_9FIRM|nr:hypothetical protein HMPREF0367_01463 [[Eubacterium] cylindroides ATCC 27803] [Faecalitalea cylindroides ATCC 27803]
MIKSSLTNNLSNIVSGFNGILICANFFHKQQEIIFISFLI